MSHNMASRKVAAISLLLLALAAIIAPSAVADKQANECTEMCQPCEKDQDCCQERNGGPDTCRCLPLPSLTLKMQDREHNVNARCQCKGTKDVWEECTTITYAKMMKVEAARVKAEAEAKAAAAAVTAASTNTSAGH